MPKNQKQVNPDLVRQDIEGGRMGDRELERKSRVEPDTGLSEEDGGMVWDDDQRQLI